MVKIQRPAAGESVRVDVDILARLAERLERSAPWARSMRVQALSEGFGRSLLHELDYRREVASTELLAATGTPRVRLPGLHPALCTSRVIVMERIDGVTLGSARERLDVLAQPERAELARLLLRCVLRQVLETGVFHADLHPGNVVLTDDGDLVLLDAGSVGVLDRELRLLLLGLLASFDSQDNIAATTLLLRVLPPDSVSDPHALRRDLGSAMTVLAGPNGFGEAGIARLFEVFRDHGLALPPHVAGALRTFASLQGCLEILDPGLDVGAGLRAGVRDVATSVLDPRGLAGLATSQALAATAVALALPERLDTVTRRLAEQDVSRGIRDGLSIAFDRVLAQVVPLTVAAVLVIAGVVLLVSPGGPMLTATVPWSMFLAACLGLVGGALLLRVTFRQLRSAP